MATASLRVRARTGARGRYLDTVTAVRPVRVNTIIKQTSRSRLAVMAQLHITSSICFFTPQVLSCLHVPVTGDEGVLGQLDVTQSGVEPALGLDTDLAHHVQRLEVEFAQRGLPAEDQRIHSLRYC